MRFAAQDAIEQILETVLVQFLAENVGLEPLLQSEVSPAGNEQVSHFYWKIIRRLVPFVPTDLVGHFLGIAQVFLIEVVSAQIEEVFLGPIAGSGLPIGKVREQSRKTSLTSLTRTWDLGS